MKKLNNTIVYLTLHQFISHCISLSFLCRTWCIHQTLLLRFCFPLFLIITLFTSCFRFIFCLFCLHLLINFLDHFLLWFCILYRITKLIMDFSWQFPPIDIDHLLFIIIFSCSFHLLILHVLLFVLLILINIIKIIWSKESCHTICLLVTRIVFILWLIWLFFIIFLFHKLLQNLYHCLLFRHLRLLLILPLLLSNKIQLPWCLTKYMFVLTLLNTHLQVKR